MYNRKTPYGVLDVEDPQVSDLSMLYKIVYGYLCFQLRDYSEHLMRRYAKQCSQRREDVAKSERFLIGFAWGAGLAVAAATIGLIIAHKGQPNTR